MTCAAPHRDPMTATSELADLYRDAPVGVRVNRILWRRYGRKIA